MRALTDSLAVTDSLAAFLNADTKRSMRLYRLKRLEYFKRQAYGVGGGFCRLP